MKFLDANGLALFTKKIFSKFVSNITGADNKITITKGDGTTNEINLNEVVKTDVIGEDPPDDDNSNKIASTRWVQKFVTTMVFKLISKLAGTEETGVSSSGSFLGVNWLIAQNGYICLGKLFGGLILQWGCAFTAFSKDNIISVNLPISSKTLAITTNILKNSPSTPQAISNAFMDNSQTVNTFSICHNLGNEKYAVLYDTISYL